MMEIDLDFGSNGATATVTPEQRAQELKSEIVTDSAPAKKRAGRHPTPCNRGPNGGPCERCASGARAARKPASAPDAQSEADAILADFDIAADDVAPLVFALGSTVTKRFDVTDYTESEAKLVAGPLAKLLKMLVQYLARSPEWSPVIAIVVLLVTTLAMQVGPRVAEYKFTTATRTPDSDMPQIGR